MKIKWNEIDATEEMAITPFSFVTYSHIERDKQYFKNAKKHIKYLLKYLDALVLHSKCEKCRIIRSDFGKNEINQPEFYCIKEPISWNDAQRISREQENITNFINELENE